MSITFTEPRTLHAVRTGLLPLAAGLIILGAVFWPECRAAVSVWLASTAYGHCFLVVPIAAFLVWDRRDSLRGFVPQTTPILAIAGLPLPFIWLAAERLGIMEGRQLVAIGFVELMFLTFLGWPLFRALLGPLLYLVFLVPFGAFITPLLQSFTARFIDIGLLILGIPHFVSDMTIEISAGTFFVAEACAGLRFLIASVAFGVFFALLNYCHTGRRAAFIAASILIPIVANGFRALGIVVLGSILGSAEAAAADHLLYGWIFFSIVMLLLVAAGLPFRELPNDLPPIQSAESVRHRQPWAAFFVAIIAALGPLTALALDSRAQPARLNGSPALVALADCPIGPGEPGTASPNQASLTMICAGRAWSITVQAVPNRSTFSTLNETRRRLTGSMDPDETVTAELTDAPGWTFYLSRDPPQLTALTTWLDGRPATGGFTQRLLQAEESVFGSTHAPVIMAITIQSEQPFSGTESHMLLAKISQFVTTQPDLTVQIERLTRVERAGSS